jgi:HAD superfamily hydrolase (TIGR01549 family)
MTEKEFAKTPRQVLFIRHRQNTLEQVERLEEEYGAEVDIRAAESPGCLIVHHDPWQQGDCFEAWIKAYAAKPHRGPLILNTKEDALEERIMALCDEHGVSNYLFLDTAPPTLVRWAIRERHRRFACRISAYELPASIEPFRGRVDWLWVDCFQGKPVDADLLLPLAADFKICLVSPETCTSLKVCISSQQQFALRTQIDGWQLLPGDDEFLVVLKDTGTMPTNDTPKTWSDVYEFVQTCAPKVIFFDLDDTLYDAEACYDLAHKELGIARTATSYQDARYKVKTQLQSNTAARNRLLYFKALVEDANNGRCHVAKILQLMDCYEAALCQAVQADWDARKDQIVQILIKCREHSRLGIITNENTRTQLLKLNAIDPNGTLFDKIITSEEVGFEKPHPEIFLVACREFGVSPEHCLMVGDCQTADIAGADAVGMNSFWITVAEAGR